MELFSNRNAFNLIGETEMKIDFYIHLLARLHTFKQDLYHLGFNGNLRCFRAS